MLSGKGNENSEKTTVGLISKKATFHARHTFFSTFLCRCFARLHRETSRNFLVRRFMEEMSYVLFTSNKNCLLCFLSLAVALCHSFSRWASLAYA